MQAFTASTEEKYTAVLLLGIRNVNEMFPQPEERALIRDALNGILLLNTSGLWTVTENVIEAMRLDGLAQKWEVDEDSMRQRLHAMGAGERAALAESVSRWWDKVAEGDERDAREPFAL